MKFLDWTRDKIAQLRDRLKEPLSLKGKLLIIALLTVILFGSGYIAYRFYDFTQNNPKFCVSCHLMEPAFTTWEESEHKSINCHDCHHLSVSEMNDLLISFVIKQPTAVPERHKDHVIVRQKYCNQCHTEGDAVRINTSLFHAKHVYMEQLECTQCHGDIKEDKGGLHRFLPSEKFCTKCHPGTQVHGKGMGGLACLNCHTDRTSDLRPERLKCLYCHSNDKSIKKQLKDDATIDVRYFAPDAATIKKAQKISINKKAPMQFHCNECHHPHKAGKVKPNNDDCMLRCHTGVPKIGKHGVHLDMEMQCKDCHKPHIWKVTKESAKTDCVMCHEYRGPEAFF
jgi:hypothetical protein